MLVMCCSVEAQTQSQVKQQISRAAAQLRSMQCDFVQTKHVKMLNQNVVSTGKMYYQRSDKLRWEYVTPYKYSFILNGSKVKINGPRRSDVINVQRNKVFKEIANIMMSSVVGNCLTDTGSFKVSIAAGKTEWVANASYQPSELVVRAPRDYAEFGLRRGIPIYQQFIDNPDLFLFVSKPDSAQELWEHFEP